MKQFALRFAVTCYAIMLSITGVYSKNIMLIDCSGSVAGQAANRNENSLSVIGEELDSYLRKYQFQNDTIVLQCFTDKLLGKYEIVKYDDKAVEFIKSLGYPRRGNSDIATALYAAYKETENNPSDKIVLITDGLHNNGIPEKELLHKLSEMADKSPDKIFMLLLSEKDIRSGLGRTFDRQQGLHLIRSLSELSKFDAVDTPHQSELEVDEENIQTGNAIDANKEYDKKSEFPWMCILYVLLIILLLVLIGVVVYYCWPLFAQFGKYLAAIKIPSIALPKLGKPDANHRGTDHDNGPDAWRIRVKLRTGWSDEIISALRSKEEAQIYIAARLVEKRVNGRPALVNPTIDGRAFNCRKEWLKEKLADYDRWKDYNNADLMGEGYPPRDSNGDPYELHHIGQHQDSPFAELTWQQHMGDGNNAILHPQRESEIDRQQFDHEKAAHWMARFEDFKNCYD